MATKTRRHKSTYSRRVHTYIPDFTVWSLSPDKRKRGYNVEVKSTSKADYQRNLANDLVRRGLFSKREDANKYVKKHQKEIDQGVEAGKAILSAYDLSAKISRVKA